MTIWNLAPNPIVERRRRNDGNDGRICLHPTSLIAAAKVNKDIGSATISIRKKKPRRVGIPPLFFVFVAVLSCVATTMLAVAWKIHDNHLGVADSPSIAAKKKVNTGQRQRRQEHPSSAVIEDLIDRSHRVEFPDENRTLAFVHIGKSGGSTISLLLRNGCNGAVDGAPCEPDERWRAVPGQVIETAASKRIRFYLHTTHVQSGKMAEHYRRVSSVVAVARDPLDRFISAFLARHPDNTDWTIKRSRSARRKAELDGVDPPLWAKPVWGDGDPERDAAQRAAYKGCYPNLEELARCATPSASDPLANKVHKVKIKWARRGEHEKFITLKCGQVCRGVASGQSDYIYIHHLLHNYEAFLSDLPLESEIFVIRTQNLWQDWRLVNRLLGSKRDVDIPPKGSGGNAVNAARGRPVRNNLSYSSRMVLCEYLKNEIRIYVDLLNRAVNLSDDDIRSALAVTERNCPRVMALLARGAS